MLFDGVPNVAADGITFDQCLIRTPVGDPTSYCVTWSNTAGGTRPAGLVIRDVEIDGQGGDGDGATAPSAALEPGLGYTVQRTRVWRCRDSFKPQDNPAGTSILIEDSLLHHPSFPTGAHSDILQIAGTGAHDVTVRRCTFDGYRPDLGLYASSALMQWGSFPLIDGLPAAVLRNILIEDCYVDGGDYAMRLGVSTAAVVDNVIVRRLVVGLHFDIGIVATGAVALDGNQPEVSDVYWQTTGTTDYGLAVVAGRPVL